MKVNKCQYMKKKTDDFISLDEKKPQELELVLWIDENGKTCPGWMVGQSFEGARISYLGKIVGWKKLANVY